MDRLISLITGANTGLGYETALALAKRGDHVILGCRSEAKATAAMDRITRKVPGASLEFAALDLLDRDQIRTTARDLASRHPRLDILVNNAGVMGPPHTITRNDVELQLDANHLGHFVLTHALMPLLRASDAARIVTVSSLAGVWDAADIYWDNLNFEGNYEEGPDFMGLPGMGAYSQSKYANILFAVGLADRLKDTHITPLLAHPGASMTDLSRNMPKAIQMFAPLLGLFMNVSKPPQGAQSQIMAATTPDVAPLQFYGPGGKEERTGSPALRPVPDKALDRKTVERFWALSEELTDTTW